MRGPAKALTFIFLFLLFSNANAQSKWEALEPTLKDSTDKGKVSFYLAAARGSFVSDRKKSLSYAEKGLEVSEHNPDLLYETGLLYSLTGVIRMYNEQYAQAETYYQKALDIGNKIQNDDLLIRVLTNMALNSSRQGQYQKSVMQNLKLIPLVEKKGNDEGLADVYANISNAYYYQGQLAQSESYQLKALALFRKADYPFGIANALNTLSAIATDRKQYDVATQYADQALKLKKEQKDSIGIANIYVNLAELYSKQNLHDKQLDILRKAEAIYASLGEESDLAKVYANFGTYYAGQKKYEQAAAYQRKAIALAEKTKDPYILEALYQNISDSYTNLQSLDTALFFSKKASAEKDSITSLGMAKQIAEIETRYETEKKERIISDQNNELNLKQLQLKERQFAFARQQYFIWGLAVLFLLLILIGYLFYRKSRLQQQQRLQRALMQEREKAAHTVIIAEEKERKRIAQDLHDGVGQMLSAIKMNLTAYDENLAAPDAAGRMKLDRIISLVDDSCKEVRSVSHNMMPNALLKKSLVSAVREFVDKLDSKVLQIHLYTEGLSEAIDINIETVLYRVIQECINNVIKHAAADTVDISIIRDQNEITATVEDNGSGFQTNGPVKGLGLENMKTRVEYLNGTLTIDSANGRGTVVSVHVPLSQTVFP